jgi:MSHA biogenesis protein MshK
MNKETLKASSLWRKRVGGGAKRLQSVAGVLMLALACEPVQAQDVTDPTRPPAAAAATDAEGKGSGLQSVFISSDRRAAVIGGQLVELGHKYGDATLVRVSENEVTLARGRDTQVLRLFPGIEKRMTEAAAPQSAPPRVKKARKSRPIKQ